MSINLKKTKFAFIYEEEVLTINVKTGPNESS